VDMERHSKRANPRATTA